MGKKSRNKRKAAKKKDKVSISPTKVSNDSTLNTNSKIDSKDNVTIIDLDSNDLLQETNSIIDDLREKQGDVDKAKVLEPKVVNENGFKKKHVEIGIESTKPDSGKEEESVESAEMESLITLISQEVDSLIKAKGDDEVEKSDIDTAKDTESEDTEESVEEASRVEPTPIPTDLSEQEQKRKKEVDIKSMRKRQKVSIVNDKKTQDPSKADIVRDESVPVVSDPITENDLAQTFDKSLSLTTPAEEENLQKKASDECSCVIL